MPSHSKRGYPSPGVPTNDLVALRAKHDENVANLDVAKISLSDVSHELAKAKHELELVKDAPIVSDVFECDECPIFKSNLDLCSPSLLLLFVN